MVDPTPKLTGYCQRVAAPAIEGKALFPAEGMLLEACRMSACVIPFAIARSTRIHQFLQVGSSVKRVILRKPHWGADVHSAVSGRNRLPTICWHFGGAARLLAALTHIADDLANVLCEFSVLLQKNVDCVTDL